MTTVKIMQGDSHVMFFELKRSGVVVTPDTVSEIEITVGSALRKLYSSGDVGYDWNRKQWYFYPTQEETLSMEPDGYEVQARIKYPNGQYSPVKGITIGRIVITEAQSKEVI